MRLPLVRGAFLVVAVQAEHVQQRVAAVRERDAERGQVQRRRAHLREQLLLFLTRRARRPRRRASSTSSRNAGVLGRHATRCARSIPCACACSRTASAAPSSPDGDSRRHRSSALCRRRGRTIPLRSACGRAASCRCAARADRVAEARSARTRRTVLRRGGDRDGAGSVHRAQCRRTRRRWNEWAKCHWECPREAGSACSKRPAAAAVPSARCAIMRAMSAPRLSKYLRGVHCFACETSHDPRTLLGVCQRCGMPLRVDYDLGAIRLELADRRVRVRRRCGAIASCCRWRRATRSRSARASRRCSRSKRTSG